MEKRARYEVAARQIRPETMLPRRDHQFVSPTAEEVRSALKLANLTGSQAGTLLGVDGRTVRKWTGGEREIPYSAWRLLLIYLRAVEPELIEDDDTALE